ncbi:MAG: DNA mismatch repair protein MutS [Planctomycetes bacterium]|nr:DNA mismatch repair protein MutS [Planctomycetota bacterium]
MASHDTPMMRQYLEVKAENPEALLLMRMGDFYEAFLEDAKTLARVGGVALTSRNKDDPDPLPMAGIPHHQLQTYLPRLLAGGLKVAVMDQLEDPAQAKGLVKRGLTRLITPGTLIDEDTLPVGAPNHLVALTGLDGEVGIAALDVSTGRFTVELAADAAQLALALARLQPAELVLPEALRAAAESALPALCAPLTPPPLATLAAFAWKPADARRHLGERLRVASLDGFGIGPTDDLLASAAAAALRYAEGALRLKDGDAARGLGHVRSISRLHHGGHLVLDAVCRRNLDLVRNARDGSRAGTLLAAIDRTRSAPGTRLLAEWLARPLAVPDAIAARHDAVAHLAADDRARGEVRSALSEVYDLERLLARLATARANARDLVHLAGSLAAAGVVRAALGGGLPALLAEAAARLDAEPELAAEVRRVLVDDPPLAIGEGGLVRDGVDPALDELRGIRRDASAWLADYQAREAAACGLPKLKVGYNSVFGYYIELSRAHADKVPAHFVRKQTLVGVERYITPELKEYEDKALGAEDRIRARELELFAALRARAEAGIPALQAAAAALALVDVVAGLAEIARSAGWCRPLVDGSTALELADARHPVVEEVIGRGRFVANDCRLDAEAPAGAARLAMITGPNMAGKSTYIRQVAVAVILAQAGSFVPARSARIGVVDRVFTRVGAGDELARGQSTFMVEMAETAAILHHATRRSLVVLDEVGRGTSTFDGVSLAWAITEHLHDRIGCRALFATHYHELTDLAADRPGIGNLTVTVAEQDDEAVFLHRIEPGSATKSYGIHVARLAGVPAPVIRRAREVLATLEQLNVSLAEREGHGLPPAAPAPAPRQTQPVQLTLFQAAESATLQRLKSLDLDDCTPRRAFELLGELQRAARAE